MFRISIRLSGALLAACSAVSASAGECYAIKDARIVVRPGYTIDKGNLVLRDGRIEAVGDVPVPFDAEVIDGHELVLYPGFIDSHTTLGISKAKEEEDKGAVPAPVVTEDPLPAMGDAYLKGVKPEFAVEARFGLDADGAKSWREVGFTAALSAPEEGYVSGQSALVSLDGKPRREALIRPRVAMHAALNAAGQGYPGTLMGALAYLRQLLLDARRYPEAWAFYKTHRASAVRPPVDATFEALQPVLSGAMPVVFRADGHLQMRMVLGLADQFGLRCMIDGAGAAHRMVDQLATRKTPLIVRLDFPNEPKRAEPSAKQAKPAEKPGETEPPAAAAVPVEPATKEPAPQESAAPKDAASKEPATKETPETASPSEPEEQEPELAFLDRQRRYEEAVKNAATLNEHGIPFALTTAGCENAKKFFEHLRVAVKSGLPEEAALRALTETPAQIFQVADELGSLEAGKLAHVVAFDGSFLDEKSQARLVFVDGHKFEMKVKPAKKKDKDKGDEPGKSGGAAPTSIAGTWSVSVDTSQGAMESTLTLEQSGNDLTGTMKSEFGTAKVTGSIDGVDVEIVVKIDAGGREVELKLSGKVDGDSMSGTMDSPFGEPSKFKASRTPSGKER